jgi:hypothetical protein
LEKIVFADLPAWVIKMKNLPDSGLAGFGEIVQSVAAAGVTIDKTL